MNRKAKKMAGTHIPIGKRKKTEEIPAKKGPEFEIRRNSGGIPADFPTKVFFVPALRRATTPCTKQTTIY